jgi:hypothetical protein
MKECKSCKKLLPLDAYELLNKVTGTRRHTCKACKSEYLKKWSAESKQRVIENRRNYYAKNKELVVDKAIEWAKNNPGKRRKNALAYYYRLQDEAIVAYGGYRCACCGETEPMFLALDHINNDGNEHRKLIGSTGGHKLYKWLKDNHYPAGFQVLCMNCNHGKHRNGGICPHKQKV